MPTLMERIRTLFGSARHPDPARSAPEAPEPVTEPSPIPYSDRGFALALYWELHQRRTNLFFSPLSIRCALGMALLGAKDETAAQMGKVLDLGSSADASAPALVDLIRRLEASGNGGPEIAVANSLWAQIGASLEVQFIRLIAERYGGSIYPADFRNASDAARTEINRWVKERTRRRIRELIPQGGLDADTSLVLANAVYFKGAWQEPFDRSATSNEPFYTEDGRQVRAPLMCRKSALGYMAAPGYHAVDLEYENSDLSMLVLLPDRKDGLRELERTLSIQVLADCVSKMAQREVRLFLPRFKMTWGTVDLTKPLQALGMELPFTDQADFSGINGHSAPDPEALFISRVLHKAFVEVNEEGTEAAAASGVVLTLGRALHPPPVPVFRADHPFLFAIHDRATSEILFLGRVGDPT